MAETSNPIARLNDCIPKMALIQKGQMETGFAPKLFIFRMSDHLFALRLFARVARRGSFSADGRELGIPQSTASRAIAELERRIYYPESPRPR